MLRNLSRRIATAAVIITLVSGFVPILVLSLITNSFWPRSKVTVPMSLVPSVLLGDSIFLPLFNGLAALILNRALRNSLSTRTKLQLNLLALLSLLISISINGHLHELWMRNEQTGYISLVPGTLSFAGKWHLAFASTQMAFVLWFVCVCVMFAHDPERLDRGKTLLAWRIFMVYAALAIGDFAIWHLVIARTNRFVITDSFALTPLPLAAALYWYLARHTGTKGLHE